MIGFSNKLTCETADITLFTGPKQVESLRAFVINAAKNATQADTESDSELESIW